MTNVGALLAHGAERVSGVTEAARMEAELLLCEVLQATHVWLVAHPEAEVTPQDRVAFERLCERRAAGEPFQYIMGSTGFYGRRFFVDAAVLVPRPETEHLIEAVLEFCGPDRNRELAICDVGAGSGAIAVTLACELPGAKLTAIELSPEALAVARRNGEQHGVGGRITLALEDLLTGPAGRGPFDVIAANLPYVSSAYLAPHPAPLAFEPRIAVDGGVDGLEHYRRLLPMARASLAPRGLLVMEAGFDSAPTLAALAELVFPGAKVTLLNDYAQHPRLVVVRQGSP